MPRKTDVTSLRTQDGGWVGPQELQAILAEEGYASGQREQSLKSLLTELGRESAEGREGEERGALIAEIRSILSDEQDKTNASPISDDTL